MVCSIPLFFSARIPFLPSAHNPHFFFGIFISSAACVCARASLHARIRSCMSVFTVQVFKANPCTTERAAMRIIVKIQTVPVRDAILFKHTREIWVRAHKCPESESVPAHSCSCESNPSVFLHQPLFGSLQHVTFALNTSSCGFAYFPGPSVKPFADLL